MIKKNEVNEAIEVIEGIPDKEKAVILSQMSAEVYSGPIPHPRDFEQYEKVLPGSADRILAMAEKQSEHRQQLEKAAIFSDVENSVRGQWFAFILGLVCAIGGIVLIALGKSISGLSIFIGSVGGLAGLFIYGKNIESKERQSKNDK